jgi:hypothetical protein
MLCNLVTVMTSGSDERASRLHDWLTQRLPSDWLSGPIEVDLDREEAQVVLPLAAGVDEGSFRAASREQRIQWAQQAEEAFGIKISWGIVAGGDRRLFTTVRAPLSVALALSERQVLDGLVDAGVAGNRAEAVAWCIRLVGRHESDWLRDLRDGVAAAPPGRRERPVAL